MAKQLNVNLAFTADTSQAQQSINALKASLQQITNMPSSPGAKMSADMQLAVESARELQIQLTNAFNIKTGNLDLNALNTSLAKSGQNLSVLTTNLLKAGQTGQQAFMNIQRVVANSSVAITKANGVLAQFATTLANTARWQLSSSILHGFMGALSSAFNYAEDLNESLNNIRIVTGYNTDKMAEFAKQANKAAQTLSATTVAYTDASLIYFQQGLDDEEVQKRTAITMKMANATGQSVVEVSDQLTAVWNNFAKGADNLEYYADAMAALGAATASSTDEIATGLNKFAAVAETVGLSYEYAAAALATVTATTRQSADVVGTAFKTLFARIQDLELGETLDDGTTLGKYSEALAKVGVDIKDASGNLRKMDDILTDMAAKWDTLSQAQQVALAQTVAGVRQYTQLIALMENWDFMETNLGTVATSEGTLQEQADIYAEGWVAAKKEVTASLEALYNELIPTDFLVDMTKAFADVVDGVTVFVKGLGGLKGILLVISTIVMNRFQPAIANGINDAITKIQGLGDKFRSIGGIISASTSGIRQTFALIGNLKNNGVENLKAGFSKINADIAISNSSLRTFNSQVITIEKGLNGAGEQTAYLNENLSKGASATLKMQQLTLQQAATQTDMNSSFGIYLDNMSQVYNIQSMIEQHSRSIAATDKAKLSAAQEQVIAATERKLLADQELDILKKQHETLIAIGDQEMINSSSYYDTDNFSSYTTGVSSDSAHGYQSLNQGLNLAEEYMAAKGYAQDLELTIEETNGQLEIQSTKSDGIFTLAQVTGEQYSKVLDYNTQIATILSDQTMTEEEKQHQVNDIVAKMEKEKVISSTTANNYRDAATALTNGDKAGKKLTAQMRQTSAQTRQFALNVGNSNKYLTKIEESTTRVAGAQTRVNQASLQHNQALANTISLLQNVVAKTQSVGGALSSMFSGLSTIAMGWNSISNAIDTVNDKEASFGEKFTAIAMAGTMGFQALMTVMKGVSTVTSTLAAKQAGLIGVNELLATSEQKAALAAALENTVTKDSIALDEAQAIADTKELLMNKLQISDATAEAYAREFVNKAKKGDIALSAQETVTNIGLAASEYAVLWPLLLIVAALGVLALIVWAVCSALQEEESEMQKLSKAIAEQQKTVESLNETLEETKTALEDITSLLEEYEKLDDAFDGLIEGSVEWLDNLTKQNELVQELINKYPELIEMGAVGFKNGVYQILNEDLVNQYTKGQATIDVLKAELALLGGQQTLAFANAELNALQRQQEFMYKKWTNTSTQVTDTSVTAGDTSDSFYVNSNIGGYNFSHKVTNATDAYSAHSDDKGDIDMITSTYSAKIADYAAQVHSAMVNGVMTAEEAVAQIIQDDIDANGYTFTGDDYDVQSNIELLTEVANTMYYSQEDYQAKLQALQDKEIAIRAKLIREFEIKWQIQAQSILARQKGYSALTDLQKAGATVLTGKQLSQNAGKYDYGLIGQGRDLSVEFTNHLATAMGYEGNDWGSYFGTNESRKDIYNDAGDFFKQSNFGRYLMDQYLKEEKGVLGGLSTVESGDDFERDSYKITYGDGEEVRYSDVLDYFTSQYEYAETNYAQIMSNVSKLSDATLAALTGDVSSLSENDVLNELAHYNESTGYTLDMNSNAYKTAERMMGFTEYDETQKGLYATEEEWMQAKLHWQEQLTNSVKNYDAALAESMRQQRELEQGDALIAQAAETYELNAEAVQRYAKTLHSANKEQGLTYENAAKMAIANARLAKGIKSLRDNWEDASKAIASYGKDSFEYFEAIQEIATALTDIFGVDVSADFIEANKEKIQVLVDGGEKAAEVFQELELLAAKDYVANLAIDDDYKTQFSQMLTDLSALEDETNFVVGIEGEIDPSYIASLNKLLSTGALTVDQIQSMFNSIGWSPDITYDEIETSSEAINQIFTGNKREDVAGGGGTEMWERIVTYSTTQVPILGDKATAIPKAPSSVTAPNTKKSGGGGNNKKKKEIDKEKERYYEINQALDTLEKKLNKVEKAKERAFGKAKSDLIKQEISLIDDEIEKTDLLLDEIAAYAETDMANLAAFGFTFDEDNNINNYDEIMAREIEAYNAAIDSGNEGQIAAAEERWTLLQDYLKQYEETMNEWDDAVLKQMEEKHKKYAKLFENLTYTIEVDLNLEEDQIKVLDHLLSMLEDKSFSAAEAIALLGDKTQSALNQSEIYARGITELLSLHGIDKDTLNGLMDGSVSIEDIQDEYGFSDEDADQLREYIDGLMEANTSLLELRETVQEKVMDTFQEWNEEMDKGISKIEHLGSVIDAYKNLVDLVGKATLGLDSDFMKKIANTKTKNAKDALVASQAQWKASVEAYDEAERQYNEAVKRNDKDAMEYWKDQMEELAVESDGYYAAMQESWANALQAAQDEFELTVQETVDAYEKAMAGTFGNLEALQAVFDQQNEVMDRYVADYTKIYELSKLNRDIVNSIDETDNVKAKKELRDLQEEITALQESDAQMSQYDLDYLRAKYELRLAEIALEEAQNAKSQVRMRRDSEGNYSYVFTADESEVTNAAQNYEDKLYEMQQLNNDYIREVQNNILQSEIELANALRELDRTKFASDEEYYAEVNRLTEYYTGQRNFYLEELNKSLNNNAEVYTQDWTRYSVLTGYKISADEQYLDKFTETVYAQITGYESIAEAQVVFTEATGVMVQDLHEAFETWQLHVKEVMEKAGTSIEKFGADTEKVLNDISTQSAQSAADVTSSASQFTAAFGVVCAAVSDWQIQYNSSINSAIESNVSMMTSCTNLISMLSNVGGGISTTSQQFIAAAAAIEAAAARIQAAAAAAASAASGMPTGVPSTNPSGTGGKMTAGGTYFGSVTVGGSSASKVIDGVTYWSAGGGWVRASDLNSNKRGITITSSSSRHTTYYIDHYYPITKYKLESLDTGGYTGEWGSNGRLALLHQKELVLNAQDTENMLSAINIIRDIARVIDLNAASSANAFALMSSTYATHSGQTIEQEVTIHAEFPNATNHSEIEEAFNTLINQAAQFANRKN